MILLADEPTGELDEATAARVLELLRERAADGRRRGRRHPRRRRSRPTPTARCGCATGGWRRDAEPLVRCDGAARTYGAGATATVALQPTDCEVAPGARIALVGPSGSGKSTLLHLMAGLDAPDRRHGRVAGARRASAAPGPVAVVFQGPSLLPPLTVVENVALPLVLGGAADAEARAARARRARAARPGRARRQAARGDLRRPGPAGGGRPRARRRAAAAARRRADRPARPRERGAAVVDVLLAAAEHAGAALVVATHDPVVAERLAGALGDAQRPADLHGRRAWSR